MIRPTLDRWSAGPGVSFERLMNSVALGVRDEDTLTSLAGRLARLDREIDGKEREEIAAKGKPLKDMINILLDAVDPDKKMERAREIFKTEAPTEEQVKKAAEEIIKDACAPLDNPGFRNAIIEIHRKSEQIIDTVSKDTLVAAGFDDKAKGKGKNDS